MLSCPKRLFSHLKGLLNGRRVFRKKSVKSALFFYVLVSDNAHQSLVWSQEIPHTASRITFHASQMRRLFDCAVCTKKKGICHAHLRVFIDLPSCLRQWIQRLSFHCYSVEIFHRQIAQRTCYFATELKRKWEDEWMSRKKSKECINTGRNAWMV